MTRKQLHEIRLIAMYYSGNKAIDDKDALIDHIDEQQCKVDRLRAAISHMLYSADAMWEEKNMGHDWPEACDYARDTLKETEL